MKGMNSIGDFFNSILNLILKFFVRDKYEDKEYYYVLNQYIMKGNTTANKIILKGLNTALMYQIFDVNGQNKIPKQKTIIGNLFILVQNLIAVNIFFNLDAWNRTLV